MAIILALLALADEVIDRGCGVESETCRQKIDADLGDRKR